MSGSQKSMCGSVLEYHNDQDSAKAFDVEPHQIKALLKSIMIATVCSLLSSVVARSCKIQDELRLA